MAESVGQIGLDLVVNQSGFNKQMYGIKGLAKKAGAALAAAFAVKKIVDFGKQCIELGSDLAEVQNVVDVTFTTMSKKVDEFAKGAATQFGLSETMTKRYIGTFGAMAKAFGFSESAAYDMSTTLTSLAGDVASFYNISQDEAYTKLKSVFTGETESLKELGVVMTQTALDQFALANGFGKTTAKMSEAEKVALRYAFVQKQLATASGDFARTSDGWANQVRILNLQFDSLKATIGQGLINLFTPIIKVINILLGKLATVANAFKAFTELITGNKSSSGGGVAETASDLESAAGAASDLADNTAKAGKAAKEASKQLGGIDKLNNITSTGNSSSGSGTGGASAGGSLGSAVDFGKLAEGDNIIDKTSSKFQGLIDKVKELASLFVQGFKIGFGDTDFSKITFSLSSIKESIKGIFTDPEVTTAAKTWVNSTVLSMGKVTGSVASVGVTIATLFTSSIAGYLEQNSDFIKDRIVSMLDTSARGQEILSNFWVSVADIFTVFRSDTASQIGADLIAVFMNSFLGINDLTSKFSTDLLDTITAPIINNKDKIKTALEGTLEPIQTVTGTISAFINDTWEKILETYDTYVAPAFQKIRDGLTEILGHLLDAYNTYILPVFNELADKFNQIVNDYIAPLRDQFLELVGEAVSGIAEIWEQTLVPFINWVIDTLAPYFAQAFEIAGTAVGNFVKVVSTIVSTIFTLFGDLIGFIVDVFTGDWKGAWENIKKFFSDLWNGIKNIVTEVWNAIKGIISAAINFVKDILGKVLGAIKGTWDSIWNGIKDLASSIWSGIKTGITEKITDIKDGISKTLDTIKDRWSTIWNSLKTTVTNIFQGIWKNIKGVINSILGGIEGMANGVVKGINKVINAMNNLSFDIPDWIPGMGGKKFGFNIPTLKEVNIPRLAQGGYVKANTPQLAMIGDNLHQGEVVAPEDKLQELLDKAVNASKGVDLSILVDLMRQIISILKAISGKEYLAKITTNDVVNALLYENEKAKNRTGKPLLT